MHRCLFLSTLCFTLILLLLTSSCFADREGVTHWQACQEDGPAAAHLIQCSEERLALYPGWKYVEREGEEVRRAGAAGGSVLWFGAELW